MTKQEFQKLVEKVVLLDGATGTNLIAAGMQRGTCTEKWVLEHEEILINLQRAYVEAGSQIIYAPTFGANRIMLQSRGMEKEIRNMNSRLVELSKKAVSGKAYVAGDITTSGKILGATEEYIYDDALEMYKEQISYLAEAGADLLVAETMIHIDEAVAAVEAASNVCDLPIICSMTVEADGTLFSGGTVWDAVATLQEAGASAVGINCSVGPDQLEAIVTAMKQVAKVPIIVKPNAGMPVIDENGKASYTMNAEDFAFYMKKLVSLGAGLIGGCCGTTPEYIARLKDMLRGDIRE